jgi:predicted ester cyclase
MEEDELMAMHSALEVVSEYMSAMAAQDNARMNSLCSPDFVMDLVHCDVFEGRPLSVEQTKEFWPCCFAAFPEMDYEVTRTIAAEKVVVTQWIFTGTNTGRLQASIFGDRVLQPTGRNEERGVGMFQPAVYGCPSLLAWPCLESHSQAESSRCILTRYCTRICMKEIFIP